MLRRLTPFRWWNRYFEAVIPLIRVILTYCANTYFTGPGLAIALPSVHSFPPGFGNGCRMDGGASPVRLRSHVATIIS